VPGESKPLTIDTFGVLERLAGAPLGRSARELSEAVDTQATPRLNYLARRGFARVDHHTGLWTITHEGWDHFEAREPDRAAVALALWRDAPRCTCEGCAAIYAEEDARVA
jgi:hypothetical protein